MSAAPGRVMMAWVWISLVTLARLNTTEGTHRDADGGLAGLEALFSDSEPPVETRSGGSPFPVPVWKFLKERGDGDGGQDGDFGRPQFRCRNGWFSVRFSLIRHSDLHLLDGKRLLSLPDGCSGSVRNLGPWLLLKLPYTSCHVALQISNGTWFHQLKVHYFDHLLQVNVTGVATCENPATSLQLAPPLVICRTTDVTVKLPLGTRLKRVKALGEDGIVGRALTMTTPDAVFVQISTPVNTDSILEMVCCDSAGEMSTMLAACFNAITQSGLSRHPRALKEADLWDLEEVAFEPYSPEPTESPSDKSIEMTESPCVTTETPTKSLDTEVFELWGFEEIPDGPYVGDHTTCATTAAPCTSTSACTTSTASTTTTCAPLTTSTCSPPTTTTTCAPLTTSTCRPPTTMTCAPLTTSNCSPLTTTTCVPPTTSTCSPSTTTTCVPPTTSTCSPSTTTTCVPPTTSTCSPPTTTTTTTAAPPTTRTTAAPPTTRTTAAPPTTTTTTAAPPTTTTTTAAPPTTTTTTAAPPTTTTTTAAPPTTTTTTAAPPTTTTPTTTTTAAPPTTTTTTAAPPTTTLLTTALSSSTTATTPMTSIS